MDPLNRGIHAEFAAPLRVQDAALEIMGKARSAGAWLHMFYRVRIIEQVQVLLNGEAVDTVEQLWVESGFRALALSRIGELICTTMTAIRIAQGAEERESAHAAAVILRHEILTFMAALPLNPNLVNIYSTQLCQAVLLNSTGPSSNPTTIIAVVEGCYGRTADPHLPGLRRDSVLVVCYLRSSKGF